MCESEEIFYEDERRLKESGVRNVFTPHTPINQENLFRGRITEVQQILSTLNTPGSMYCYLAIGELEKAL